jgi:tRNA-splicing ligase RtcB
VNHFIEIQAGDDGYVWLMIHSGSRNIGKKIADFYHKRAVKLCERWKSDIPDKDLSFLPIESRDAKEYFKAMEFALEFAKVNRQIMMDILKRVVHDILNCDFKTTVNIHHNYAAWENHFGKNVIIHRKGATRAREGELGIIPGSIGTSSYIVRGLGNQESFNSCSHGAGRRMGRKEASRTLTREECDEAMKGVVFGRWSNDRAGNLDLGEAPQAYKDIDEVIKAELDLIEPIVRLKPLGVIKG